MIKLIDLYSWEHNILIKGATTNYYSDLILIISGLQEILKEKNGKDRRNKKKMDNT